MSNENTTTIAGLEAEVARLQAELKKAQDKTRLFPMLEGPAIPWHAIAPHDKQARHNHSQSLERLAERGGLSHAELWFVMNDIPWATLKSEIDKAKVLGHQLALQLISDTKRAEMAEATYARLAAAVTNILPRSSTSAGSSANGHFPWCATQQKTAASCTCGLDEVRAALADSRDTAELWRLLWAEHEEYICTSQSDPCDCSGCKAHRAVEKLKAGSVFK